MNKFLVVSPYPPPYIGGHLVYMATIVDNCTEGFDILTHAMPEGEREIIRGKDCPLRKRWICSMFKQPTWFKKIITYPYMLAWILVRQPFNKYKAILVNWAPAPNGMIHILGKLLKIPTIGFLHGEEITLTLKAKGVKGMVKRLLMKYGYKQADGFIASCHFIKERAVELGIDPSIIDVIPVCFNPKNRLISEEKKGWGHNIITVGTAVERKGFHLLVDAVHELRGEFPNIKLNIVGEGPFMPVVKERIRKYGLEDHVILHGNLFEEKLSKLLIQNDLFVLANIMVEDGNTEGGSLVVCDASSHGLPVIGGTGGGLATTITDGETGFIVNARDIKELTGKIRTILTHPELAHRMGQAGKEKVKRDHNPKRAGQLLGDFICTHL